MRIGKAKPARSPAARPTSARWKRAGSSPMSVTHADSPVTMTFLGSQGTSAGSSLAARKAAKRASSSRYQTPVDRRMPVAGSAR